MLSVSNAHHPPTVWSALWDSQAPSAINAPSVTLASAVQHAILVTTPTTASVLPALW